MKRIYSVTKAYHSTKQKGLKKFESRTTTATIDTGEGAHIHGWGLYLQADEMENRELYYDMFAGTSKPELRYKVHFNGKDFIAESTDDICNIGMYNSMTIFNFDINLNHSEELALQALLNNVADELNDALYSENDYEISNYWDNDEIEEAVNLVENTTDFNFEELPPEEPDIIEDGTHSKLASQYTVEIPDDMVFIDEDEMVGPHVLEKYANFISNDSRWIDNYVRNTRIRGRTLYEKLQKKLGSDEQASLWLSQNGIDGMTYEGGRDGGCFVIYNCEKLRIIAEY